MRNETRKIYKAYAAQIAQLNGVDSSAEAFTTTPSVQQTLETHIQESSSFLKSINIVPVRDMQGEKVGLGVSSTIAGRTSTANLPRNPGDPTGLDDNGYECKFTEFDTAIGYAKLDMWSKFPDFQVRVRNAIIQRQALDRIMIGFNGTSAATQTDRTTNALLQDVNIGWLQKYRSKAPSRVMSEVVENSGKVRVGPSGDYENLDALVFDAVSELVDPWHQDNPGLVAICGRALLHDKYFPLVNSTDAPTERLALDMVISQKRLGGRQAVLAPFFPANSIFITSLENLSLYYQEGARRRHLKDEPEYNRIANYESSNDAYVVEDYGFGCLIENIELDDYTPPVDNS